MSEPIARSSIPPHPPTEVVAGWEVSGRRSPADLRISDWSPLAKVLVRVRLEEGGDPPLGTPLGRVERGPDDTLVVGSGPGEWTLLGPPGSGFAIARQMRQTVGGLRLSAVVDLTHGRTLLRVTGAHSRGLLTKVCAFDLDDRITPDGSALRTSVAGVVTDLIRDDAAEDLSYLLHCDRSFGRYLFEELIEAGVEFGIDVDGFRPTEVSP